ncbi:galactosylgalactosylxylosylprotein 3-beta-glucuronosyltransferase I [Venturia canescens]|uniref:galactosylgalactosylxylosylprotein 3-beta-glucuronosyltransferase I n=1 Tax=Venturia canescens TaxID=32260 RepID=UPI001C9D2892|nr:galactosylgalactosylxylosylprotein 3-beta-glucuronosyltransferase I [Venturia canescens]
MLDFYSIECIFLEAQSRYEACHCVAVFHKQQQSDPGKEHENVYLESSRWESTLNALHELDTLVTEQANLVGDLQSAITRILGEPSKSEKLDKSLPTIFAITPTFARPAQKAELTRLVQTFLHVPNFHWILVEDSQTKTKLVTNFLAENTIVHTHLNALTPPNHKLGKNDPAWKQARGVQQRNAALRWIREELSDVGNGIVYFADDDNTYSVKLFKEMSKIKKVGVWPVGLVGGMMVERPICDNATNKVTGFNAVWKPNRVFPVDMAGFAVHIDLIREKKDVWFSYETEGGYQETVFLEQLATRDDLEPLADACTKVYVWHTRTEPPLLNAEQRLMRKGKKSNEGIEV